MKKAGVIFFLTGMFLIFCLSGCQDANGRDTTQNAVGTDHHYKGKGEILPPREQLPTTKDEMLYHDEDFLYFILIDESMNPQGEAGLPFITHSVIYKFDYASKGKTEIYTEPDRNYNFNLVTANDDWIYLSVWCWQPASEAYHVGIAKIDRKNDKLEFFSDLLAGGKDLLADGLFMAGETGYFFVYDLGQKPDLSVSGIYRLDSVTSGMEKIGPLPEGNYSPTAFPAEITVATDGFVNFYWYDLASDTFQKYSLDIASGVLEKLPD